MAITNLVKQNFTEPKWTLIDSNSTGGSPVSNVYLYNAAGTYYRKYRIFVYGGVYGTTSANLRMQINGNSSSVYNWSFDTKYGSTSTIYVDQATSQQYLPLHWSYQNTSSRRNFEMYIDNPMDSAPKLINGKTFYYNGGSYSSDEFYGMVNDYNPITSIRFFMSSGSLYTDASYGFYLFGAN